MEICNKTDCAPAQSLVDICVEAWRFTKVFERAVKKINPADQKRYMSSCSWFVRKTGEALEKAGMRIVNLEGKPYDPGFSATPLNINEFCEGEALIVEQMIEPVVMAGETVVRNGIILLGKV